MGKFPIILNETAVFNFSKNLKLWSGVFGEVWSLARLIVSVKMQGYSSGCLVKYVFSVK